jgi:hypothetical protein
VVFDGRRKAPVFLVRSAGRACLLGAAALNCLEKGAQTRPEIYETGNSIEPAFAGDSLSEGMGRANCYVKE